MTENIEAVAKLANAAAYIFQSRCPEHFQGYESMSKADQAAVNILDYAARGIKREFRRGR